MFVHLPDQVRFSPTRPMAQVLSQSEHGRVVLFGCEPGQGMAPHTNPSMLVMQVVEGRGRLLVGEEERSVAQGDLAICPPAVLHGFTADPDERLVLLVLIGPRP